VSVATTLVYPAIALAELMATEAAVTLSPTAGLPKDARFASLVVLKPMTPVLESCAAPTPIVKPVIVIVTAVLAASAELRVMVSEVEAV
jgi:hypothetical protein